VLEIFLRAKKAGREPGFVFAAFLRVQLSGGDRQS
jgi:hypothetical protein